MSGKRLLIPVMIFTLALCLLTGCDSTPEIRPLNASSSVLAFGDSLTYGTGAGGGQSYPDVLSTLLGSPVINAGIPGEISADGLTRLPQLLDEYQPDLVILCHGGNDFLRQLDRTGTVSNLRAMISLCKARGADVVLVGVPQFGLFLDPAEFYQELATEFDIPYQAEILSELLGDRSFKSDTIHPNSAGYRLMAEAIHALIIDASG